MTRTPEVRRRGRNPPNSKQPFLLGCQNAAKQRRDCNLTHTLRFVKRDERRATLSAQETLLTSVKDREREHTHTETTMDLVTDRSLWRLHASLQVEDHAASKQQELVRAQQLQLRDVVDDLNHHDHAIPLVKIKERENEEEDNIQAQNNSIHDLDNESYTDDDNSLDNRPVTLYGLGRQSNIKSEYHTDAEETDIEADTDLDENSFDEDEFDNLKSPFHTTPNVLGVRPAEALDSNIPVVLDFEPRYEDEEQDDEDPLNNSLLLHQEVPIHHSTPLSPAVLQDPTMHQNDKDDGEYFPANVPAREVYPEEPKQVETCFDKVQLVSPAFFDAPSIVADNEHDNNNPEPLRCSLSNMIAPMDPSLFSKQKSESQKSMRRRRQSAAAAAPEAILGGRRHRVLFCHVACLFVQCPVSQQCVAHGPVSH